MEDQSSRPQQLPTPRQESPNQSRSDASEYRLELALPWPPSINGYWRAFNNRQIISVKGRQYRKNVYLLVTKERSAGNVPETTDQPLEAKIVLHPPDRRRRDWDNWHKPTFDALVNARVLRDDCQIKKATVEFGPVKRGGEYRLVLSSAS